jgi:hypothetical protein
MPTYVCKRSEEDPPFLIMEAEGPYYPPTKITPGENDMGAVGYARQLSKTLNASARAIASRMGHDVIFERAEGDDTVEKTDSPVEQELDAAIERIRKRREAMEKAEDQREEIDLMADGEIAKADEDQRIVFGWAYVTHDSEGNVNVDKSGDFIDAVEEIEKSAYDFVLHSRNGDADHTNVKAATLVESIVFTPEKIEKMGLPSGAVPLGWWLGFKVEDDDTWARVKKGELRAFSIHGKGTRKSVD